MNPIMTPSDFLTTLRARGITVSLRNGRIALDPKNAFKALTPDEQSFIRSHRYEIKSLCESMPIVRETPAEMPLVSGGSNDAPRLASLEEPASIGAANEESSNTEVSLQGSTQTEIAPPQESKEARIKRQLAYKPYHVKSKEEATREMLTMLPFGHNYLRF